jgi:glycosyltransferase involved in cell wall biosynthesis
MPQKKPQTHCTPPERPSCKGPFSGETPTELRDSSGRPQTVRRPSVVAPTSLLKNGVSIVTDVKTNAPKAARPAGILWRPPAAVVMDSAHPGRRSDDWEVGPTELRELLRSGGILQHLLRHSSVRLLVDDLEQTQSPKAILVSRLLTVGPAWMEDRAGRKVPIGPASLARLLQSWWRDRRATARVLEEAESQVADLERTVQPRRMPPFTRESGVLFLRTDWARGVRAGGSVAHLAGVLNELERQVGNVDLLTTDAMPLLDPRIRVCAIQAEARTWTRPELHQLHFNRKLSPAASALARPGRIIYQRYGAFNWTGAALSRQAGLPFVLEFNGPETWLAEHWGVGLLYPELAGRIEQANLEAADLVSVVSEPLRRHVLARGIPEQRIIILPNGVDAERFRPDLDSAPTRESLGLGDRCAIGFIGTFGPWHGVETLAEAFVRLLQRRPDLSGKISLVLIGDGQRLPGVRDILRVAGMLGDAVLTGLVPQAEGPAYLAACDILVLPTAPNPDGSPFFGSPTKLFEYMAMGRSIVATSLGQTSEVLEDGRNALLVSPSDPEAMSRALERFIDDPDMRQKLGAVARQEVLQRHTWQRHVARLLARVEEFAGARKQY